MGDKSNIEWTDATWNPVTGCTKVSPGCANCYIERTPPFRTAGRRFERGVIPLLFYESRLDQPLRWTRPRMVFVNSLSDMFHEGVEPAFISEVFGVMAMAKRHTFQVLTKRAPRMCDLLSDPEFLHAIENSAAVRACENDDDSNWEWPLPNVWLGVSVENQHWADVRVPLLLTTPAAVRWVSYEPALGPVDFLPWLKLFRNDYVTDPTGAAYERLDWVVVGGESGPGARPFDLAWARGVIEQGRVAGVPVFVKQIGAKPTGQTADDQAQALLQAILDRRDPKGGDWDWWPPDMRVREYPKARPCGE